MPKITPTIILETFCKGLQITYEKFEDLVKV